MDMPRRVRCVTMAIVLLNLTWSAGEAIGQNWTIGTDGKGRWTYGQYSQLGANGFFGPYNVDRSAAGNFAPLNGWMGVQNFENPSSLNILVSGTNSSSTVLGVEWNPNATFGWATVKGRYKIIPYDTATAPGAEVSISPGQWTNWGLGVTMPIGGSVFVGKSSFHRGAGLQFGWNRTQEYILFESDPIVMPDFAGALLPRLVRHPATGPIGPVIVKICRTPKTCPRTDIERPKTDCSDGSKYLEFTDCQEISECVAANPDECQEVSVCADCPTGMLPIKRKDPVTGDLHLYKKRSGTTVYTETSDNSSYLKLGFGFFPWERDFLISTAADPIITPLTVPIVWNSYDVNLAHRVNLLMYLLWNNDVIDFQVGALYSTSHAGPELATTTAERLNYVPTDRYTSEGWAYLQYCNNRVRLRTELDWFNRETRYQSSASGQFFNIPAANRVAGSGSFFAPDFTESLRFMADASVWFGPVTFTLFYSHMSGPDRRHGILVKKQPYINTVRQAGLDPFYSVSSLLAYRFGGGVKSPGDLSDASVIAGRIDYSLAANLGISTSFLSATRVSHGYGWGWIRPSVVPARFGQVDYDPELGTFLVQPAMPPTRFPYTENVPAIPARDLGWEMDVGFYWQLLDQFSVELTLSYWQPGKWFNYACADKSVPGWENPTAANNWGINPNRSIDPILGIELALLSSF
jgi:hypothetical protein